MQDNHNKLHTLTTFGLPSADVDFLAMLQKFIEREAERRQRIVPFWAAVRVDGVLQCVIDSESWCQFEFEGVTSKVEIVGRDAEGEVVVATYLPTYDGPKTEAWKVWLPWGDEVSCTFEYDDEERVRVEAKRIVKPELGKTRAQLTRAPQQNFVRFDRAYVERLRKGDPATEHHLAVYFEKLLSSEVWSGLISPDKVEDLKREAFIRVISAVRKEWALWRAEQFKEFANSICNNVLLEYYRAKNHALEEAHVEIPDRALDLDATLVGKQSAEHVRQFLKGMPRRDRDLLRAIFLEERDKASVCREFGVDRDYLRVLLLRAKDKFKDNWADLAPVWDSLLSKD